MKPETVWVLIEESTSVSHEPVTTLYGVFKSAASARKAAEKAAQAASRGQGIAFMQFDKDGAGSLGVEGQDHTFTWYAEEIQP
jgi:hypothetical protein